MLKEVSPHCQGRLVHPGCWLLLLEVLGMGKKQMTCFCSFQKPINLISVVKPGRSMCFHCIKYICLAPAVLLTLKYKEQMTCTAETAQWLVQQCLGNTGQVCSLWSSKPAVQRSWLLWAHLWSWCLPAVSSWSFGITVKCWPDWCCRSLDVLQTFQAVCMEGPGHAQGVQDQWPPAALLLSQEVLQPLLTALSKDPAGCVIQSNLQWWVLESDWFQAQWKVPLQLVFSREAKQCWGKELLRRHPTALCQVSYPDIDKEVVLASLGTCRWFMCVPGPRWICAIASLLCLSYLHRCRSASGVLLLYLELHCALMSNLGGISAGCLILSVLATLGQYICVFGQRDR